MAERKTATSEGRCGGSANAAAADQFSGPDFGRDNSWLGRLHRCAEFQLRPPFPTETVTTHICRSRFSWSTADRHPPGPDRARREPDGRSIGRATRVRLPRHADLSSWAIYANGEPWELLTGALSLLRGTYPPHQQVRPTEDGTFSCVPSASLSADRSAEVCMKISTLPTTT